MKISKFWSCVNAIGVFQAMATMIKCTQTACPPYHYRTGCEQVLSSGELEARLPTLSSDRICIPRICSIDQYEIRPKTTTTDRQYATLTVCTTAEFEKHAPTPTTDRQCQSFTTCNDHQVETHAPTPTTDRQCTNCFPETDFILNCANPSSRSDISSNHICDVKSVDNCCCSEFYLLKNISGNVNIRSDETMLYFGTIATVDGHINGEGFSEDNRGPLQNVNLGQVTHLVGNLNLRFNMITHVHFGSLMHVGGRVWISSNSLSYITMNAITYIGLDLSLRDNFLTAIDFGALAHIGRHLLLFNNNLNSIELGTFTQIGNHISVRGNSNLEVINCYDLGSCLCHDSSNLNPVNCPTRYRTISQEPALNCP
eukprot:gene3078-biopygen4638